MFDAILREIVEGTGGGIGAILMGYDGIAIEQYFDPQQEIDLQLVAVEYANVLKEIKKTAEILNSGDMEEVSIKTDHYYVLIRTLGEEYFIALSIARDGNFGKGRYLLMREAPNLMQALA